MSPGRRQAIIWTNDGILLIWSLGTNLSEILSKIHTFSFNKMHLQMSSAKWRPFCSEGDELAGVCIISHNELILTKPTGVAGHDLNYIMQGPLLASFMRYWCMSHVLSVILAAMRVPIVPLNNRRPESSQNIPVMFVTKSCIVYSSKAHIFISASSFQHDIMLSWLR